MKWNNQIKNKTKTNEIKNETLANEDKRCNTKRVIALNQEKTCVFAIVEEREWGFQSFKKVRVGMERFEL